VYQSSFTVSTLALEGSRTSPDLFYLESFSLQVHLLTYFRIYADLEAPREGTLCEGLQEATADQLVSELELTAAAVNVELERKKKLLSRAREEVLSCSKTVLLRYLEAARDEQFCADGSGLECYSSVVCVILNGFLDFSEIQFLRHLPEFFYIFMELIECGSADVRKVLGHLMRTRIAKHLGLK
jgi:hypothetical protein